MVRLDHNFTNEEAASLLERLATHYVARFATTRARLIQYLKRKAKQKGFEEAVLSTIEAIADKMVALKWVDDEAFATARVQSLTRKGMGERRISNALQQAGVSEEVRQSAFEALEMTALEAAHIYARRKRLGPYAQKVMEPRDLQRAYASMIRAGHNYDVTKSVLNM